MTINDQWAEQIANLICDPHHEWTDHILPPTRDRYTHMVTIVEGDEYVPLCEREFEQVLIDGGSVGDHFGWYYNREVPLALADAEYKIDQTEEALTLARSRFHNKKEYAYHPYASEQTKERFENWVEWNVRKADELKAFTKELDTRCMPAEEDATCGIYTYLEMYIDSMSLGELAFLMDVLEDLHASKEISWFYYVQCGLAVCYRLAANCPKGDWDKTLVNLRKHNETNHVKTTSYEDRFYGEMSFSMESAIDLMDQARQCASRYNGSIEAAMYSILEDREDESSPTWTPTLKEL